MTLQTPTRHQAPNLLLHRLLPALHLLHQLRLLHNLPILQPPLLLRRRLPNRLITLAVLLQLPDEVVEVLLPLKSVLEGSFLEVGVVFEEELFLGGGNPEGEGGAADAEDAAAGGS